MRCIFKGDKACGASHEDAKKERQDKDKDKDKVKDKVKLGIAEREA